MIRKSAIGSEADRGFSSESTLVVPIMVVKQRLARPLKLII